MGRRSILVLLAAVGAAALGWLAFGRAGAGDAPEERTVRHGDAATAGADLVAPVLQGQAAPRRSPPPAPGAAEASPVESTPAPVAAPDAAILQLEALAARIRREVCPETWTEGGGGQLRVQGDRVLVVKAPGPVHDEINAFLQRLRADALRRVLSEAGAPIAESLPDGATRLAGEEELRALLRGVLAQWQRLERALAARGEGRTSDALRLLDEVLAQEPDHAAAADYRQVLVAPPPAGGGLVDLDSVGSGLERAPAGSLEDVEDRVRGLGWASIDTLVPAWPSRATFEALERARRRAGMSSWSLIGAERELRLAQPAPALRLEGLDLFVALQRLSIETLIPLKADPQVVVRLRDYRVGRVEPSGPTLGDLLAALAAAMGPGLRFLPYPSTLLLTTADHVPRVAVAIFDVSDLLEETPVAEEDAGR